MFRYLDCDEEKLNEWLNENEELTTEQFSELSESYFGLPGIQERIRRYRETACLPESVEPVVLERINPEYAVWIAKDYGLDLDRVVSELAHGEFWEKNIDRAREYLS